MSPALVWHAYPLGLLGADQSGRRRQPGRRLPELATWLPHVAALGADTVLLGPVFRSLSHGYDTVSHLEVDERLGTDAELVALVRATLSRSTPSSATTTSRDSPTSSTPAGPGCVRPADDPARHPRGLLRRRVSAARRAEPEPGCTTVGAAS